MEPRHETRADGGGEAFLKCKNMALRSSSPMIYSVARWWQRNGNWDIGYLTHAGWVIPRSTRTIWKILDDHHRIVRPGPRLHEPEERPEPGVEWGIDFHDVSSVPADPQGKRQHVVEILNLVDHGSSAVVAAAPHNDYTAETACQRFSSAYIALSPLYRDRTAGLSTAASRQEPIRGALSPEFQV